MVFVPPPARDKLAKMLVMKALVAVISLWCSGALAGAAHATDDWNSWEFRGEDARVVQHLGEDALLLREAIAWLPGLSFDTGVIEFDLAVEDNRAFPGVAFRAQDLANYEHFYVRPHQSGNPDANQYTPVFNRVSGWQIYYGEAYSAPTRYQTNVWIRVRIEVAPDSARVFINSVEPVLIVRDLKRERQAGFIALLNPGGNAYFANWTVLPGLQSDEQREEADLPEGLVREWRVSDAMAEAQAYELAAGNQTDRLRWESLEVETNGIANLARAVEWSQERPTALARLRVRSDRARSVLLRFGYSDRVRVYLNGDLLYEGDDTYSSRDYRFLGTVGLYDAVPLRLRRGDNELVLAITEAFGGWGAMAAFDDIDGLTFGAGENSLPR